MHIVKRSLLYAADETRHAFTVDISTNFTQIESSSVVLLNLYSTLSINAQVCVGYQATGQMTCKLNTEPVRASFHP